MFINCSCLALVVWTIIATIEDPNAKPENATEASNISHILIDDTKVTYECLIWQIITSQSILFNLAFNFQQSISLLNLTLKTEVESAEAAPTPKPTPPPPQALVARPKVRLMLPTLLMQIILQITITRPRCFEVVLHMTNTNNSKKGCVFHSEITQRFMLKLKTRRLGTKRFLILSDLSDAYYEL